MFNDLDKMVNGTPKIMRWNLFWWKIEGCELLNGLNVYPPSDKNSAGFAIKFGDWKTRVRFSKRTKQWHFGYKF